MFGNLVSGGASAATARRRWAPAVAAALALPALFGGVAASGSADPLSAASQTNGATANGAALNEDGLDPRVLGELDTVAPTGATADLTIDGGSSAVPTVTDAISLGIASAAGPSAGGATTVEGIVVAGSSEGVAGPLGIPAMVFDAYRRAADRLGTTMPECRLDWPLLAGIGRIESGHARGGAVSATGDTVSPILGPVLSGGPGMAVIRDTDGGRHDGDASWDRAVGPMQFIPSTWAAVAVDGNDDGVRNPHNIYDAALASGYYLCGSQTDVSDPDGRRRAVFRYNHSDDYVAVVLRWADAYAAGAQSVPDAGPTAPPAAPTPTEDLPPYVVPPPPPPAPTPNGPRPESAPGPSTPATPPSSSPPTTGSASTTTVVQPGAPTAPASPTSVFGLPFPSTTRSTSTTTAPSPEPAGPPAPSPCAPESSTTTTTVGVSPSPNPAGGTPVGPTTTTTTVAPVTTTTAPVPATTLPPDPPACVDLG